MSRRLAGLATERIEELYGALNIIERDLSTGLPSLTSDWVDAQSTPENNRSNAQQKILELSDTLIEELRAADTLLIAVPVYNFSIPASLKAWIDLVCRARVTFSFTDNGPVGLLKGKRALVLFVSGGTRFESDADFVSNYLRHILKFVGITEMEFIPADSIIAKPDRVSVAECAISDYSPFGF